jgi:hypothetical protein
MITLEIVLVAAAIIGGLALIVGGIVSISKGKSTMLVGRRYRYRRVLITGKISDTFSALRVLVGFAYLIGVVASWTGLIPYEAICIIIVFPLLLYRLVVHFASFLE